MQPTKRTTKKTTSHKGITMDQQRLQKKISILGDPAVGKTSLIQRFVYGIFDDKYLSTFGAKITKKTMLFGQHEHPGIQDTELTLLVWDIAGQKAFKSVHQAYYRGSEGALVVCDITRRETLDNIREWVEELRATVKIIPAVLLINKCDLKELFSFGEKEIEEVASKLGIPYYVTSAKTGHNVEKAFQTIAEFILGIR